MRAEYGWRGRVGVIVPPANGTVEPELAAMLPSGVALHAARLPGRVVEDTSVGLRERFLGYNRSLAAVADSFGGMALSAVCLGVTGCCYLAGTDGEEALLSDLRAGGAPHAITAARALRVLLEALGRLRIGLVVPYPAWVTELATAYWRSSGFEIAEIVPLPDVVSIYAVDTGKVVAAAEGLRASGADVILLSGTGVPTLPAIERLAGSLGVPVISSNLALGWWILRTLDGIDPGESPAPGLRQLGRWLAPAGR